MSRTTDYENFTITHVGENEFGRVYAVYSKLLKGVFADIRKRGEGSDYELCIYDSGIALSSYGMKNIVEFIELISKESGHD